MLSTPSGASHAEPAADPTEELPLDPDGAAEQSMPSVADRPVTGTAYRPPEPGEAYVPV